ncbi:hypothetical protein V2A60_006053 [Cordyceps javanica]
MSLNGLDNPKVTEAFQTAAAEPGGWFLLKYTSRDEVELLGVGAGGITELRTSIEEYDEDTPLYGYIKYRRRNVVLKYLPEDSSRLIQARVAVHFNFVCERFSPYDTIFEIDSASTLTDTKLSAACSLHTASGSTASSTSSRKKRLVEIAEEDEDDQPASKRKSVTADAPPPKTPVDSSWNTDPVTLNADLASSPEQSKFSAQDTTEPPTFVGADERPSTSDSYDRSLSSASSFPYGKPKVKLGPRPSLDVNVRPQTAGNFRPVSAIPAGYKLFGKGSKRNKSRESNTLASPQEEVASMDFAVAADPDDASKENTDPALTPSNSEATLKTTKKISPEKARLKKAMQLREKKRLAAEKAAQTEGDAADTAEAEVEAEAIEDALHGNDESAEIAVDGPSVETPENEATDLKVDAQLAVSLADEASEATATDSHPASPALGDSETADSTKASSISEGTDETVREKEDTGDTTPQQKEADALAEVAALPEKDLSHMTTQDHIKATEAALFGAPDVDADVEEPVPIPISKFSTNNSSSLATEEAMEPATDEAKDRVKESAGEPEEFAVEPADQVSAPQPSAQEVLAATRAAAEPSVETPAAELVQSSLAAPAPATPEEVAPIAIESKVKEAPAELKSDASNTTEPEPVTAQPQMEPTEPAKEKRKGLVDPIQTTGIDTQADANQTPTAAAVMAEAGANPSITATPVTPVTPEGGLASLPPSAITTPQPHAVRTVSNPVRGSLVPPVDTSQSSARSMSSGAAYLHKISQQQQSNASLSSKSNVGSSISQRIKALEMLSASSGTEVRPASRERPQSTFFSVKKSEPLRAPSVIERASSLRMTAPPSRDGSDSSPETGRTQRARSGSISNRLSMFQPSPDSRGGPESISVTAKIVRDHDQRVNEPSRDVSGFNPLDLKQSPLFVSHQKPVQEFSTASIDSSADSFKDDRRPSVSIVRGLRKEKRTISTDPVPTTSPPPANGSFSPRMSFSSSRRSTGKESEEAQSPDANDSHSGSEEKSNDGKRSRASRFMRRLSTLSGTRSKTALPPSVKSPLVQNEEQRAEASRPSTTGTSPWIVSYLGDVNVQFPDNLLWKRRNLCIDSQGFLVLSALPAPSSRAAQGTKRYHLSEFRPPYCPDVEVQELPNSVVLDFVEGTSLQLACEDRTGQVSVLNDLSDAHSKHAEQFGQ